MGFTESLFAARPKAATGPGVYAMENYAPITSMSRSPQKLMHEALGLYRSSVWVNAAERAINSRFAKAPFHLERPDGETIYSSSGAKLKTEPTPAEQAVIDLIERPNRMQQRAATRRGLWSLSSRHAGLAGNFFWFLDQTDVLAGTPLGLLYINPVRMTPAEDDAGNLLGWVLDHPQNPVTGKAGRPGVPIRLEEVEHGVLDEPDDGHFGIGWVEAAYTKVELSRLADRHAAQVLGTGGRLAGLMSPKTEGSVNAAQWEATIRAWRQIVDDPESAKRLHIVRGPVDFTATAAKPAEMELKELAQMSRQDILAAAHVPESQIGIHGSSGLNSGEHIKFEEAALWQGPIEDRMIAVREPVQRILDRFAAVGVELRLVIDTPSFDDEQPLYENAERAKVVPLTVNQRLEMVGRDPLDPSVYGDFGEAIFIDQTMVRVDPKGVDQAQEQAEAIAKPRPIEDEDEAEPKASLTDDLKALRARIEASVTPTLAGSVGKVLDAMRADIAERVVRYRNHLAANPFDSSVWFDTGRWKRELSQALIPATDMASEVATAQAVRFRSQAQPKADEWISRVAEYVRLKGLDRVDGMLSTTRDSVQKAITEGIRAGLTADRLADAVQEAAGLSEYRAELIARTEVMQSYNDASLRTFREFGAEQVMAIDGDADAECAARNGAVYSISEASAIVDHPNGTLDWSPVVEAGSKATLERERDMTPSELKAMLDAWSAAQRPASLPPITIQMPEQAPAPITINVPEQPAPTVQVTVPEQQPPAP